MKITIYSITGGKYEGCNTTFHERVLRIKSRQPEITDEQIYEMIMSELSILKALEKQIPQDGSFVLSTDRGVIFVDNNQIEAIIFEDLDAYMADVQVFETELDKKKSKDEKSNVTSLFPDKAND